VSGPGVRDSDAWVRVRGPDHDDAMLQRFKLNLARDRELGNTHCHDDQDQLISACLIIRV
jgi:hypothetical protein